MTVSTSAPPAPITSVERRRQRVPPALLAAVISAVVMAAVTIAALLPLASPAAPSGAVSGGFPVQQAAKDLAVVAASPHPLGSPAQLTVEQFLVSELRGMGLDPQVQVEQVTLAPDPPHSVWTAPVRNVIARLRGSGADHAATVMIAAHYDSVPSAPGAGDNGAGVVAVLETMRLLAAGAPPRHDVVAVFTDGEEHEMLGSAAVVNEPWLRNVRVVLNTEGIGNGGRVTPALTSDRNGRVLRQYLHARGDAVVYTALDAPLNALDQGADLGRYQDVVPAGIEFSIIGGLPAYHAGTDTAAALNRGTLAEYGTVMLDLTRRLASSDLQHVNAPDLVAFTLTRHVTVAYSSAWSLPLALLTVITVIAAIGIAWRRRAVRLRRVATGWLGLGLAGLAGLASGTGAWMLATQVDPRLSDAVNGGSYHRLAAMLAVVAAAVAGMLLLAWPLRRRHTGAEVAAGGLFGVALLAVLLAVTLPTAAYVATWPTLAGAAALAYLNWRPRSVLTQIAVATAAVMPAILLVAPLVATYFVLAARFELTMGIVAAPLPLVWLLAGLAVAVPLLSLAVRRLSWRPAAVAAGTALALVAAGAVIDSTDNHPRPDALVYQLNADTGTARWVAVPGVDGYTRQVAATGWHSTRFEADPFHRVGDLFAARSITAPVATGLTAPTARITGDTTAGAARVVSFTVQAPPGTYALSTDVRASDGVRALTVDRSPIADATDGGPSRVRVVAFAPGAPVFITATVAAGQRIELRLTAYLLGLPRNLPLQLRVRSSHQTAGVYEVPDATVVTRTITA
ncbi:MAG TPA: M20/M25/M40 family metallo-hydrolase [Mycobacteriales bacterium]|jgi:hypothetical protein|nr:M20/M25/M40 family metallo-hydrolase [Mycobacteriales bacterium]